VSATVYIALCMKTTLAATGLTALVSFDKQERKQEDLHRPNTVYFIIRTFTAHISVRNNNNYYYYYYYYYYLYYY